jgi:hypothetical protein
MKIFSWSSELAATGKRMESTKPTIAHVSLRGLLALTAMVGIACLTLVKPSPWWIFPMPAMAATLTVYGIQRWTIGSTGEPFHSVCVVFGAAAYFLTVLFVQQCFRIGDERDVWVAPTLYFWSFIHGAPSNQNSNASDLWVSFYSFLVCLHAIVAIAVSAFAALILPPLAGFKRR